MVERGRERERLGGGMSVFGVSIWCENVRIVNECKINSAISVKYHKNNPIDMSFRAQRTFFSLGSLACVYYKMMSSIRHESFIF